MFYYVRVVFQNQIQAQQAIYVKQQQHQMAPQQGEFFKANDSMSALPTNFSDLAMNKEPQVSTRSTVLTAVQDPIVSQRVVLLLLCFTQYCSQKPMLGITYEIISCIELYHKYPLYTFSLSRFGNMYLTVFFLQVLIDNFYGFAATLFGIPVAAVSAQPVETTVVRQRRRLGWRRVQPSPRHHHQVLWWQLLPQPQPSSRPGRRVSYRQY